MLFFFPAAFIIAPRPTTETLAYIRNEIQEKFTSNIPGGYRYATLEAYKQFTV